MTSDDHILAAELAEEAGKRLLDLRAGTGSPDELRKAGDRLSHEFLAAELAARRPGDAVLSEEGRDNPVRLSASRVWIVDPLDGTREFGEAGRTDWAVHVALWEHSIDPGGHSVFPGASPRTPRPWNPPMPSGPRDSVTRPHGTLTAGAVALPAQGQVLSTAVPPVLPPEPPGEGLAGQKLRVVVSRTRPPAFLERLGELADLTLMPLGSAGAKAAAVIQGEADAYVHAGGQYEWDSAAPVAVAVAAGLHASRIDGSVLEYNQPDPVLPDILMCRGALAKPLLDAIAAARATHPA